MSNIKKYFKSDFSGALLLSYNNLKRCLFLHISSVYMKIKLKIAGVKLGENVKFGGIAQVERFPLSEIIIGNSCKFNSKSIFNQRGIKQCIIQTGKPGASIRIGNNCGFSGVSIVSDSSVLIGNNTTIGANTIIGDRDDHPEKLHTSHKNIIIGNNVFIGMHCLIMKGVKIGDNSIIGAGSIVTKDIPENVIAVGIPCKVIKDYNK